MNRTKSRKIAVGDTVWLRIGGPPMKVVEVISLKRLDAATVTWTNRDGGIERRSWPTRFLTGNDPSPKGGDR